MVRCTRRVQLHTEYSTPVHYWISAGIQIQNYQYSEDNCICTFTVDHSSFCVYIVVLKYIVLEYNCTPISEELHTTDSWFQCDHSQTTKLW